MRFVPRALRVVFALVLVTAAAADSTPPNFHAGYPSISNVDGSSFDLNVKSNEAGTVYYYVVAGSNPTPPTPAQLQTQYTSAYGTTTILKKGAIVVTADTANTVADNDFDTGSVTGLSENQVLSVFLVAEDGESTPNIQTAVTHLSVTTADDTPPTFVSGFPKATEITATDFNLVVELDEPGLFHWAVLPAASPAPTALEMAGGTNANAVAYSATAGVSVDQGALQKTVTITGLAEATDYKVYVLARDDNGANGGSQTDNVQLTVTDFSVTTADETVPTFESTFPSVSSATTSGFDVSVQIDEPGQVYYVVVLKSDNPPTAAQVVSQPSAYGSTTVLKKGIMAVTAASTQVDTTITGLDDLTEYSAYVVPEDAGLANTADNFYYSLTPNVGTSAERVNATTLDATAPLFVGTYTPALSQIDGTSFDIDVQLDEPGDVFYVVVKRTTEDPPTPPTAAETKSGNFANTVACGSFTVGSVDTNVTATVATTPNPDTVSSGCDAWDPNDSNYALLPGDSGAGGNDLCSLCPLIDSEEQYWVYVLAEDDETTPNTQTAVTTLNVTTTDVTPPEFKNETASNAAVYVSSNTKATYGYAPNLGGVALEVTTSLDEPGMVFYMVVDASHTAPTAAQVKTCGATRDGDARSVGGHTYTPSGGTATAPFACGFKEFFVARVETAYVLSGIGSETDVKIHTVAEDFEDQRTVHAGLAVNPPTVNLQSAVTTVTATSADITPPEFNTRIANVNYPRVQFDTSGKLTDTKAAMQVALNEPGVVWYVVVTRDLTFHAGYTDGTARQTPTAAEIRAGTGPGGLAAADAGSVNVTAADTAVAFDTTAAALVNATAYDVYLSSGDDFDPVNYQGDDAIQKLRFTTRDADPPAFLTGFPAAVTGGEAVEVTVEIDEPGTAYFVVVARGDAAPTSAQVVAGAGYSGVTVVAECGSSAGTFDVPAAAVSVSCTAAGLTEATDYDVYVVAQDTTDDAVDAGRPFTGEANTMASPVLIQITTADTSAPGYNSGPDVTVLGTDGVSLDFEVDLDEPGKVWYVVDVAAASAPSSGNVKMGTSSTGAAVAASGSYDVSAGGVTETISIANQQLKSGTAYNLHVAVQDDESVPNLAASVATVSFTTPDVMPPKFVGQYTKAGAISAVLAQSFDLTVALDEQGTTYYVVVEKGDSSGITPDDVRNLRGGAVGATRTVVACGAFHVTAANTNATVTVDGSGASCVDIAAGATIQTATGIPALPAGGGAMTDEPICSSCPYLAPNTEYDVYIVAEDDGGHASPSGAYTLSSDKTLQAAVTKVSTPFFPSSSAVASLKTADDVAPVWDGSPNATNFFGDGFDIDVSMTEPGVVFYSIVRDDGSFACVTDPTPAKVKLGLNGCDDSTASVTFGSFEVDTANTTTLHTVDGLDRTRGKDEYTVWVVAADHEPTGMSSLTSANTQTTPVSFTASTLDTQPPTFDSSYPMANNPVSSTGKGALTVTFDVVAKLDEPGTVYYVAFPTADLSKGNEPGSTPPSAANVKAGVDSTGAAAAESGNFSVTDTTVATVTTTGVMTDSTEYTVYVVAEDDASGETRVTRSGVTPGNNLSPVQVTTITTADGTAVLFSGNLCADASCTSDLASLTYDHSAYPFMSDCAADSFKLTVKVNEPGSKVHYTVVSYADATALEAQSDPTNEEVALATVSPYTPALTSNPITPIAAGSIVCTNADTDYHDTIALVSNTEFYQVFVTTEGPGGNVGDGDTLRTANENPTKLAPCVAPQLTAGSSDDHYQKLVTWTGTDTTLKADVFLTAPAEVFYVLLKQGSDAPNPTQIVQGMDAHGNAPPCEENGCDFADTSLSQTAGSTECGFSGTSTLWDTNTACTLATFTNLSSAKSYDLFMVTMHATGTLATDNTGPDGNTVFYSEFSRTVVGPERGTPTDTSAPFFSASYPKAVDVTGVSATFIARLAESGNVSYVVLDKGATAPSVAQVKAGTDASDVAINTTAFPTFAGTSPCCTPAETNILVALTGLTSKKVYEIYIVATDSSGNDQAAVTKKELTAASADGHLGGIAVKTVVAAAGANGEQTTTHAVQPAFDPEIFEYRTFVNVSISTVTIMLSANDTQSDNLITVNGTSRAGGTPFEMLVAVGRNVFAISVTAGDAVSVENYKYTVVRASDDTVLNASLSLLDITMDDGVVLNSTALGGQAWPKCVKGCDANSRARCSVANPECVMDATVTHYVARVPQRIDSLSIAATAARSDTGAVVKIFTKGIRGLGDVLSDSTRDVNLANLKETGGVITLQVTAGDGVTKQVYTIAVDRIGPGVYGEGWVPPTASGGGLNYGKDDVFTTRAGTDPTVRDLTVIPALDVSAPNFVADYPRVTSPNAASLEFTVQLSEPGVVFYCVLPYAARAPTSREVKESCTLRSEADALVFGNITDLKSLTSETTATVSNGLAANTAYDVWFVAQDDARDYGLSPKPNLQSEPVSVNVTTL